MKHKQRDDFPASNICGKGRIGVLRWEDVECEDCRALRDDYERAVFYHWYNFFSGTLHKPEGLIYKGINKGDRYE